MDQLSDGLEKFRTNSEASVKELKEGLANSARDFYANTRYEWFSGSASNVVAHTYSNGVSVVAIRFTGAPVPHSFLGFWHARNTPGGWAPVSLTGQLGNVVWMYFGKAAGPLTNIDFQCQYVEDVKATNRLFRKVAFAGQGWALDGELVPVLP